jgi:heat shock protein HslJ
VIDLWCNSGRGQVVIAADTITIIIGAMSERQCGPDQMRGDEEILASLNQVTNWKREDDFVVLVGPKTLRFRLATN